MTVNVYLTLKADQKKSYFFKDSKLLSLNIFKIAFFSSSSSEDLSDQINHPNLSATSQHSTHAFTHPQIKPHHQPVWFSFAESKFAYLESITEGKLHLKQQVRAIEVAIQPASD